MGGHWPNEPRNLQPDDVPEIIERRRRLRSGEFDVVPGVRALRRVWFWLGILAIVAIVGAAVLAIAA